MNKDLYNKTYSLSEDDLNHLQNYSDNETVNNLLSNNGQMSYSLIKKIIHRMENGEKDSLGGDKIYNSVKNMLDSDRRGLETSKNAKSGAGVENAHIQTHSKDDVTNSIRPNKSHQRFSSELTSDLKITESLKRINELISKII